MGIPLLGFEVTSESNNDLIKRLRKIPSLNGYADCYGNIYKIKNGSINKIQETHFKDKHKDGYVFEDGKATLNEIMHKTFPELDKKFGKTIPKTDNTLSMQVDGSIWTIGFKPERFDDKRNPDNKGRISIKGFRINPQLVYKELYGDIRCSSLNDLETFLNENNIETESNNGEQFYAIVGKVVNSNAFVVIRENKNNFTLTQYVDFLSSYVKTVPVLFNKNKNDFLKILTIINTLKNINTQIHTVVKDMT